MDNLNDTSNTVFNNNDFAIYKEDGKYIGGGYTIDSFLLNNEQSPLTTFNTVGGGTNIQTQVSSLFENLAVPAGLFYHNQKPNKTKIDEYKEHSMLSDDIFDKLFGLVQMNTTNTNTVKKRHTKKQNAQQKHKTTKKSR
jgi:hypothetical protein